MTSFGIGWFLCRAFTKDIIFARVYSDVSTSSRYCEPTKEIYFYCSLSNNKPPNWTFFIWSFKNQFIREGRSIRVVEVACPLSLTALAGNQELFLSASLLWWAGGRGDSCSLKSVYFDSPPSPKHSLGKLLLTRILLKLRTKMEFNRKFQKMYSIWISLNFSDKFNHCC